MGEENLKKVLRNFGLTDSEVEVYLFVSRHGVLSGTDIAHLIRKDKAQTFRTLKNLQTKGFVETTLEVPARFAPVTFEKVLELTVKAKQDEAAHIEEAKGQLLDYWKGLAKRSIDDSLEKFVVIEGRRRVYSKIAQMVADTKSDLYAVSTFSGILRAEQFGVLETRTKKPEHDIKFRLLTEPSGQNSVAVRDLLKNFAGRGFNFQARHPNLGMSVFPRMVIRDKGEAVFFLTPRGYPSVEEDSMCLWTNSKNLVDAFTFVFEDLWRNANDVWETPENDAAKHSPDTSFLNDEQIAEKKYDEIINSAGKEILMMTSSEGLMRLWKIKPLLEELVRKSVSIKIMAPIMSENYDIAQRLSKVGQVRHVPAGCFETTIVDGRHLFQREISPEIYTDNAPPYFEKSFYSNELEHVEKTRNILADLWKNAPSTSLATLKTVLSPPEQKMLLRQTAGGTEPSGKKLTSMTSRLRGLAIIQPPSHLRMPAVIVDINQAEKQSTFGASVSMLVFLRFEEPSSDAGIPVRYRSVPVAVLETNPHPSLAMVWKTLLADTPAQHNVMIVQPDELELYKRGNTAFAGWTMPIPLPLASNSLPPSCLMFETYGRLKHFTLIADFPSGYKVKQVMGYRDAFLTFISPLWNYTGSGIEGMICTHTTRTMYAP